MRIFYISVDLHQLHTHGNDEQFTDEEVEEIQPPTQSSHDVMEGDIQTDAIVDVSPAFQELAGKLGLGIGSVWVSEEG